MYEKPYDAMWEIASAWKKWDHSACFYGTKTTRAHARARANGLLEAAAILLTAQDIKKNGHSAGVDIHVAESALKELLYANGSVQRPALQREAASESQGKLY